VWDVNAERPPDPAESPVWDVKADRPAPEPADSSPRDLDLDPFEDCDPTDDPPLEDLDNTELKDCIMEPIVFSFVEEPTEDTVLELLAILVFSPC
jgi:hypothetical protein